MSDRLTFSWFVGTCNLAHPATGPQEALWNTVKDGPPCIISLGLAQVTQESSQVALFMGQSY